MITAARAGLRTAAALIGRRLLAMRLHGGSLSVLARLDRGADG